MRISPGSLRRFIARKWTRRQMRGINFTVVSNNCWGAHIYQQLDRPYATPFVGLFLMPDCYLRLLSDFRNHLAKPITWKAASKYDELNRMRSEKGLSYPIGDLGADIEIHFLHYTNADEALVKWNRRRERMTVNDNELLIKFCDRDGCTPAQMAKFDALNFSKKVCFTSRPYPQIKCGVWVREEKGPTVADGLVLSRMSYKYFDAVKCIRTGDGRVFGMPVLRCM
ncbi:MAG TPA: DUF1919 domain-containing protein [Verrucomicrobiae bacterium]|nr:DUF1919 domain-containing protein [Verrucomicrobiae bacterium]